MTLLVTSIAVKSVDELRTRSARAWGGGAEAVEVRIDTFEDDPAQLAAYLKDHNERTWIVTCRSADEGGLFDGDTAQRVALLIAAARGTGAYVDFELADWRRSDNIRRKIRLASATTDGTGSRLILSAHDFAGGPDNVIKLAAEMTGEDAVTAGKVAYEAGHICDTIDALDLLHERGNAVTAIAMGEDGLWTRVLAKKLGAFATYCALDSDSATAPGQLTLDEIINAYRWTAIDQSTRVFGVIGDPVAHSMSPTLFNFWFAQAGVNAVYFPLRVRDSGDSLRRFLDCCQSRAWLDVGGFSVTIPHKSATLDWLGDSADHMARKIGALNTLSFCGGKTQGFNTDCYAAVSCVADALGCARTDLGGLSVDVLGTGGAARAVLYGFPMFGCSVTVYGRSTERTRNLTDQFGGRAASWEDRVRRRGDVLINCTSVGMWPDVDASPMPQDALDGCRLVFDVVYNPLETRLLEEASAAGIQTLSGLEMFVRQAATQFTLWTSITPDLKPARELIRREIQRRTEDRL